MVRARSLAGGGILALVFGLGVLTGRHLKALSSAELPGGALAGPFAEAGSALSGATRLPVTGHEISRDVRQDSSHEALGVAMLGGGPNPRRGSAAPPANRPSPGAASAGVSAPSWSEVAARAQRATVGILAGDRYGAGIVVDRSGLVLTNLHVIQGIDHISALLFGGENVPASVVARAADLDLALLQLAQPVSASAELGSARAVHVGDDVLAVGSPRKMYFSVSRGMVSFLNRKLDKVSYLQTDLPINAGNSGGPLLDREGRVIGVVSFILRDSQGLAFALPIDYARERFAPQLEHSRAIASFDASEREAPAQD